MAQTSNDRPLSALLVEGDLRLLSDHPASAVQDLVEIASLIHKVGYDNDGNPRLRRLHTILEEYVARMTAVDGKRAKQLAEVLKHEHFKKRHPGYEWDPDHHLYDTTGDQGPKGLD